eukprot:TRINITY_DN690_c0_g1_i1.p1 TRINITY_DN690_c0_g1~~TRINITY_DN690_c0_g1_i1.p1  ORF type:complete len:245 (+),score=60.79 TRINITY_DN690_c0_g1_i1:56-736(+)
MLLSLGVASLLLRGVLSCIVNGDFQAGSFSAVGAPPQFWGGGGTVAGMTNLNYERQAELTAGEQITQTVSNLAVGEYDFVCGTVYSELGTTVTVDLVGNGWQLSGPYSDTQLLYQYGYPANIAINMPGTQQGGASVHFELRAADGLLIHGTAGGPVGDVQVVIRNAGSNPVRLDDCFITGLSGSASCQSCGGSGGSGGSGDGSGGYSPSCGTSSQSHSLGRGRQRR